MSFSPYLWTGRSQNLRPGRPTTRFVVPGCVFRGNSVTNFSANTIIYTPLYTQVPLVIDQLQAKIDTSGSDNFRMGFYAADPFNGQPVGPALADSGSISKATAGVKTYTPATPIYVPPGLYLSAINCDVQAGLFQYHYGGFQTTFPLTSLNTNAGAWFSGSQTYGAFPNPGTQWTGMSTSSQYSIHFIIYRVKST